ncbi:MAG: Wzz/FepE/Etk N-terminal domain-containing protein, partial [Rikenellaceae bacterium]
MENKNLSEYKDPQSQQEEINIADLIAIFMHHIWFFIVSIIICVLLAVLYIKSSPSIYSRSATILVKDMYNGGMMGESAAFQEIFNTGSSTVQNEMGILKSRSLMREVVKRLNLDVSYKVKEGLKSVEKYKSTPLEVKFLDILPHQTFMFTATPIGEDKLELVFEDQELDTNKTVKIGDSVTTFAGTMVINSIFFMNDEYIGKPITITRTNPEVVIEDYQTKLSVTQLDKFGSLINISITDESTNRAEDILNTLIEAYQDDAKNDQNKVLTNTSTFIDERLAVIESDLNQIDAEIEHYKKTNKLTDVISESSMYLESYSKLDSEGLGVENQLNMAEYMKAYLNDNSKLSDLIPSNVGVTDQGLQAQITEYNSLLTKRNKLLVNSSVNNPLVIDLQNTLTPM